MKGYKAFNKGMVCRGKQYAENTIFEEDEAVVCRKGMHFCKRGSDTLKYYDLVNGNGDQTEFAEVEALDEPVTDDGIKYCSKKLRIGAKVSFVRIINAETEFDFESVKMDSDAQIGSSGYAAKIGSSGNAAKIGSSGDDAKINSTGNNSVIMCAGTDSLAKAKTGSWITLSEWKIIDGKSIPVCVKTEQVDGEKIKADTWYQLKDGEFVEIEK